LTALFGGRFDELTFANHVTRPGWPTRLPIAHLDLALKYAAWALQTPEGRRHTRVGVLFKAPAKTDPQNLIHHAEKSEDLGVTKFTIRPEPHSPARGFR
jgi:hypothetical protein